MRQFAARSGIICATLAAALFSGSVHAADLPFLKAPPAPPPAGAFWIELDYLAWTVKGDHLLPLVTTSPAGTPLGVAGVLGAPGTTILFGNSTVNDDWRSGGRIRAGYWFDPGHTRGVEASFFALEDASTGFAAGSDAAGSPIITRPFFNALTNLQDAAIVAFPGTAAGSINIGETSRLLGGGAVYRQSLGTWAGERVSALIGYRYLHASDHLSIASTSTFLAPPLTGTLVNVSDSFEAASNFHGVDLGLVGELEHGPWSFEWRAKVALGANFNEARINGSTTSSLGGVTVTTVGGILTGPSNIGNFSQTRFAAVPDLELKAGYQLAPQWRLIVGYEVLYWTDVQRAGGLIDTTVNPTPGGGGGGPARPQVLLDTSSLLAQGFTVGVRHGF